MKIGDKTFLNLQEAVAWLLENNALPYQSTANYVGNTEIALSTLINPSPAKVRVGSLIFFADSKVSTVIGLTSNSFIVSDQYNDLVDDIVYVSNVAINASGHLIVTLSNGDTIDAGLIKQVTGFSIDGSQHLIVTFNDGTSTDLGAIFNGNISISGNLTVSGGVSGSAVSGNTVTGDSIIENMSGYTGEANNTTPNLSLEAVYMGVVKNGNKITFTFFGNMTRSDTLSPDYLNYKIKWNIPSAVSAKIYPYLFDGISVVANGELLCSKTLSNSVKLPFALIKSGNDFILNIYSLNNMAVNDKYIFRFEQTFLLSDSLAS